MGYQRSRHSSTVATVEVTPASVLSSKGPSSSLNEKLQGRVTRGSSSIGGIGVSAGKKNAVNSMADHGSEHRYPLRERNNRNHEGILDDMIKENVGPPGGTGSKDGTNSSNGKRVKGKDSIPKDETANRKRARVETSIAGASKESLGVMRDDGPQNPVEKSEGLQENPQTGNKDSALAVWDRKLANAHVIPSNEHTNARSNKDLHIRSGPSEDEVDDQSMAISRMQEIYSKLHLKYQRLKERKFSEVEEYVGEQNKNHNAYMRAQQELLDHLRNENHRLRLQFDQENITMTLNRSRLLEQENAEYRNDLLIERAKNLELINEAKRLQLLLSEPMGLSKQVQKLNELSQHSSAQGQYCSQEKSALVQSENHRCIVDFPCSVPFAKDYSSNSAFRHAAVQTEENQNSCHSCGLESSANLAKPGSRLVGSGVTSLVANDYIQVELDKTGIQLDSHLGKDTPKGETHNQDTGTVNSLVRMLLQCIVGFRVTVADKGKSSQLLFLHHSSGFSFKLKCLLTGKNLNTEEDGELLYNVVSLGTLHKIAPEWMKEELIFSITQVNVFFERILQVANGHGHHLVVRR
eukprot:Gb_17717 [translate_table: standard]